ncbi:phage tail fiber protein [Trabulsiella guamensis ATCC 49490]|uniref:Phage tail fiber protein n=1 Tax=Trabulsiella guamensis ATCC 49490 TaxID=1005994 RepID=A0A085ART7_9ENTR|nr:hypothetical protein [Trabulsiella guamensis]KFC12932.1 phage tail fiber protein [Trabulsiella guamensis ATCC 49490]
MLTLKNITRYIPEFPADFPDVVWLQTEDGLDWYYHRARFADDTVKICYDKTGLIRSFSTDVQHLSPEGFSVTEVSPASIPEGMKDPAGWCWDGKKIKPVTTVVTTRTRAELLADLARLQAEIESLKD